MKPDTDTAAIEAILASLRVWILDLALVLLGLLDARRRPLGRRLARLLRSSLAKAERDAKRALFLLALARLHLPETQQRLIHARGLFLRRRKCSELRRFTHGFFNARHVDVRARIVRLRDMLADSETWIARLAAHLMRRRDAMHRILAAPLTERAYASAFAPLSPADSS
ncbi:MAG: hypothetical protein JNJ73_18820 [Hyphomonadaceae bacterium]|nr:hypothetical protein [Hyphomonadaceae bacterium]